MSEKVVVQVRLPAKLVKELDRLTQQGIYRDRTEAIADGVRHILDRYSKEGSLSRMVAMYTMGKLARDESVDEIGVSDTKTTRVIIKQQFGTDVIDEVIGIIRKRA